MTDTSAEAVERLAKANEAAIEAHRERHDFMCKPRNWKAFSGPERRHEENAMKAHEKTAATLRALLAERDAARAQALSDALDAACEVAEAIRKKRRQIGSVYEEGRQHGAVAVCDAVAALRGSVVHAATAPQDATP